MERRQFLSNSVKVAAIFPFLKSESLGLFQPAAKYSVQQIIDLIIQEGKITTSPSTVDTIKAGSSSQEVTGIIVTMFPTISIIREAIKRKANFIIAHEPSFYSHQDTKDWLEDVDIYKEKQQLLDDHKICIWRFHDYCHALKPDPMSFGLAKKAGWTKYFKEGEPTVTIPGSTIKAISQQLKVALGASKFRVIGDLNKVCKKILLLPGAWGRQRQIGLSNSEHPDLLIVGEISEWETGEYCRDANQFGKKPALLILGHSLSEEPGMEHVTTWLKPKLPGVSITHIASGDPFTWL